MYELLLVLLLVSAAVLHLQLQHSLHFSLHLSYCFCSFKCLLFSVCSYAVFFHVSACKTIHAIFSVGGILIYWIYLFALRVAVSYSRLYFVHEVKFVGYQLVICVKGIRVCAPLHSRSDLVFALYSKFCPLAWTPHFRESGYSLLLHMQYQSRCQGGLWWAYPPQSKLQAPHIETWNTINKWNFG